MKHTEGKVTIRTLLKAVALSLGAAIALFLMPPAAVREAGSTTPVAPAIASDRAAVPGERASD